jgi:hypothetical protein
LPLDVRWRTWSAHCRWEPRCVWRQDTLSRHSWSRRPDHLWSCTRRRLGTRLRPVRTDVFKVLLLLLLHLLYLLLLLLLLHMLLLNHDVLLGHGLGAGWQRVSLWKALLH